MVEGATQTATGQRTTMPAVGPSCDAVSCKRPPAVGPLAQALTGEARTPAPSVDPGTALQNRAAIRLQGTPCPEALIGSAATELDLTRPAHVNQPVPLASFETTDPLHRSVACRLREFLAAIHFDPLNKKAHPVHYGHAPLYDNKIDIPYTIKSNGDLSTAEKWTLLFFQYGYSLSPSQVSAVFASHLDLFAQLENLGLVVAEKAGDETTYRLNGLSLETYPIPGGDPILLFVDLPRRFRNAEATEEVFFTDELKPHRRVVIPDNDDPTVQVSKTSYILLEELVNQHQAATSISGLAADFGSGSGILAIALLKMHPQISETLAVEIDRRSMNVSRWNAMVNDVGDRFRVVDNDSPKNFRKALAGRRLDLAVSNPPFNPVPRRYENDFTDFGDGGPLGLDVTEIFMKQALPVLKPSARFILYSVLVQSEKREWLVDRTLRRTGIPGFTIDYRELALREYRGARYCYSQVLARIIANHRSGLDISSRETPVIEELEGEVRTALKRDGVAYLRPVIWTIRHKSETPKEPAPEALHHSPLPQIMIDPAAISRGTCAYALELSDMRETSLGFSGGRPGGVFLYKTTIPDYRQMPITQPAPDGDAKK